ncbi:Prephenate dehydratase [Pseudopedobacter saltans DSM 12145]|uniref:prephenate dehydratase n=1 Tax=Pseudopedobacter saltans (strain ATCC 51119 / DSM 12145 / JCM 21818 / CCUG 39354 / LMG 10337 / NBRC 100064 / NCIMB 13643) TaxID=762903 RepID=F0S806_PSESL|nr:prephenate dehydratase [Pseudopedobacter saltans]ADY51227.1 Prephenate dehydratase [Pseudopedobacter saltans DSM 12145]
METKKRVAIQGIKASFHEEAAFKFFGTDIETVECNSFKETFQKVKAGEADYIVMAIENSIAGSLLPNYSLLKEFNYPVIGEVYLHIQLHLMGLPGVKFEDIANVTSHPIAIRQCGEFLDDYPQLKVTESSDTAACAKRIKDEQLKDTAAIANSLAAEMYGLEILEKRIETNKKNYTRFLILAGHEEEIKNPNKASVSFQVKDEMGILSKILNVLVEHEINMSKIQSMPVIGKRNEFTFYIDMEWKINGNYDSAIRKLLRLTNNFNIMGEYRKNDKV